MKRQVTTNINPVLTVQELQELETKVLEYKNKILEILGKESELVKDINTRDGLFDEIKIKIKTSSELKQWIQNKELMSLLSQGNTMEWQLITHRTYLVNMLSRFDITKISSIQSAIELAQTLTKAVDSEKQKPVGKGKRSLENLDVSARFNTRLKDIQELLRKEGMKFETDGDLLEFRKKKGGRSGVKKRLQKNFKGIGPKSVTEIECFIKKEEMKSEKEKKHTDELTYTEVFGTRKGNQLESLQATANREGKNLRTHDDLIHLWKEKGGQYGMIRRIKGINGVGPIAAVYIEEFLKGKGYI